MTSVVDSNMLEDEDLLAYLSRSSRNRIVIPDQVILEAYKGDAYTNLSNKFSPLVGYAPQISILKPTPKIIALHGKRRGLQHRMIDDESTRNFRVFCQSIADAANGEKIARVAFDLLSMASNQTASFLTARAPILQDTLRGITDIFTPADLKTIRTQSRFPDSLADKIRNQILLTSIEALDSNHVRPAAADKVNFQGRYLFRFALCVEAVLLDMLMNGHQFQATAESVNHDAIDTMIMAYGTVFDDLMTKDATLYRRYRQAKKLFQQVFPGQNL